jgi:hypothetical protein
MLFLDVREFTTLSVSKLRSIQRYNDLCIKIRKDLGSSKGSSGKTQSYNLTRSTE